MKTILFTGFDESYRELATITCNRMGKYAMRHGIEFQAFTEPPPGLNIYWTGVARGLELLRDGYERVMYLDVDVIVANPAVAPPNLKGFNASKDWGPDAIEPWHFSMCGFCADESCIQLFEEAIEAEPAWRDKPFQEQATMQALFRHRCSSTQMTVHPRRVFNPVPLAVHSDVVDPYQNGDWLCHITMLPMEDRIRVANEIIGGL